MRSALPSAFLHSQPWSAPKRGLSQVLPAILDDDERTGSTTCELPDSGPANELLTSSGDEQWSFGNEYERGDDSGDQSYLETGSTSPVGLYSSPGLRAGVAALSFGPAAFAQSNYEVSSPPKGFLSDVVQLSGEARDFDFLPARPGTQPQQPQASKQQHQQQQQRLVPVFPASVGSSRAPQAKRTPPPRLAALVADVAREAAAAAAAAAFDDRSERRTPHSAALAPMPTWPPTSPGPTSPQLYDTRPPLSPTSTPTPALKRERTRSLGRSRSVGMSGAPLLPTRARQPPSPIGAAAAADGGAVTTAAASGSETVPTTRASASSILEFGVSGGLRSALPHSAPSYLQQQQQQQLGPSLGPFAATRLRTTSHGQLRVFSAQQPPGPPPPPPPTTNPDVSHQRPQQQPLQQQQPLTPWWGLPPPGLSGGGGAAAAARLGAVSAPTGGSGGGAAAVSLSLPVAAGTAAAAAPRSLSPGKIGVRASSPPGGQQYGMTGSLTSRDVTAAGRDGDADRAWPQRQASPPAATSTLASPLSQPPPPPSSPLPSSQTQPLQLHRFQQDPDLAAAAPQQQQASDFQHHRHPRKDNHLQNSSSAPLLRLTPETAPGALLAKGSNGSGGGGGAAAATAAAEPVLPSRPSHATRAAAVPAGQGLNPPARIVTAAAAARSARQSAPSLGRNLQLPNLQSSAAAGSAGAAGAAAALGEGHVSGVGLILSGVAGGGGGGPAAAEVPAAPEIALRPPRWLKPSAFQVTEQLRSGRLQELVDKLATVNSPTVFDLGGLEFSGSFIPAPATAADGGQGSESGAAAAAAAAAAVAALGAVMAAPPRHQTLRASLSGIGVINGARNPYVRSVPAGGGGGGGADVSAGMQILSIPRGQHITLYNATLLLTADQYILVGAGASLTLKAVEVLGCSRDAARQSAAVRRRALSVAAAAAAASSSPSPQQTAAAAAIAAVTSTAASGYSKLVRRTSSPGRTTRDTGVYGVGGVGRRVSVGDSTVDGGMGLPPVRRRANTTTGGNPFFLSIAMAGGQNTAAVTVQELVDANEYVEDHGLVEVVGGYLRISNCRLWPGRCQLALCVSDGGGCSLSYSTAGACCAAGPRSCLVSEQTTYDGGAAGCVSALGGARLGLSDCVLRYPDSMPKPTAAADGYGGGSAATGTGGGACDLGIEARGSGTLAVLTDCDVTNGGVGAALAARLYLQSVRVSDARGHGLTACDPGTTLYVRDCRIDDSGGSAAVSCDGAAVRVADSTLAGSAAAGAVVLLRNAAAAPAAAAAACSAVAAAVAAPPPPRSTLTLLRCDVSANAGQGAMVSGGGFLAVADSVLYNNLGCGVAADGGGSVLSASGTRLIRNEGHGVRAAGGAGAVLARCCAMGNGRDGVSVEGTGSRGHLTRCESRENRESGLCVTGSASVELSYTRLAANQHDGLAVGGDGSLAVAHGCIFNGNVAKGAVVCMGGGAELTECAVHCNGSKSVQVSDDDSRLVLGRACSLDRQPMATNGGMLVQ